MKVSLPATPSFFRFNQVCEGSYSIGEAEARGLSAASRWLDVPSPPRGESLFTIETDRYIDEKDRQPYDCLVNWELVKTKLTILADAAKYDASCASSGAVKRKAKDGALGSTNSMGICHSYAPDGRCISLLKILLTNHCTFDCAYCINRASSPVKRASFTVEEVVRLTLEFYKRNYIEGLFLSSGIVSSPDETMARLVEVARQLREVHRFAGYIHLKGVAGCSSDLLDKAARHADRISANVELPSQATLDVFAPGKKLSDAYDAFDSLKSTIASRKEKSYRHKTPPLQVTGQSTQLVVGPGSHSDWDILSLTRSAYEKYGLSRVYYSAYSPIQHVDGRLPIEAPDVRREHRLYQSDWLIRFYGFSVDELVGPGDNLRLDMDPKLTWALANPDWFPIDVNTASHEELLRVPGLGHKSANRICAARRFRRLDKSHLVKLGVRWNIARYFIEHALSNPSAGRFKDLTKSFEDNRSTGIKSYQPSLFGD